jgi:hypothetical protein
MYGPAGVAFTRGMFAPSYGYGWSILGCYVGFRHRELDCADRGKGYFSPLSTCSSGQPTGRHLDCSTKMGPIPKGSTSSTRERTVSPWTSTQGGRTVPRGQEQSHEVTYPHVARVCGLQRHCIQQAFHLHDRDKDGHRPGRLSKHRPFRCGPQALRSRRGEPSHVIISPRGRYVQVDEFLRLGMASTMLCLQVSAFERPSTSIQLWAYS